VPKLPRFLDRSDPLEKNIERAVCDYAKSLGIENRKYKNPGIRGGPDRIFFVKCRQEVFWVEFKRRKGVLTDNQKREIAWMRGMGYCVFVVDNVADGKELVDLLR
jgi:hypothetical protein